MASATTESLPYPLKRNALASTSLAGYLLHPKIPLNSNSLRLADLGAGTGIWVSEVATSLLPNAQLDAVDISDAQFPAQSIRPQNVSWWTHNCFQPFPQEYIGQFDVVNARFWTCIVNDDVADKLFQNIITLLSETRIVLVTSEVANSEIEPGGYLQWFEPLPESATVKAPNGFGPTPANDRLAGQWKKPSEKSSYNWVNGLPKTLEQNGLEVIAADERKNPDYYQPVAAQTVLLGLSEYLYSDSSVEKFQEQLAEENAGGAYVDIKWQCVVGRKTVQE